VAGVDLGEDDGFLDVTVGKDEVAVDVWLARSRLSELVKKHKGSADEVFFAAVIEFMKELGFSGNVSHRIADRFAEAVFKRAKELGEESGSGAGSQDSTPGPTPPA
jgi:hypothetical protein